MTAPTTEAYFAGPRGIIALWAGFLAAPAAFLLNLQIPYMLVTLGCEGAAPWIHLSSASALAVAAGGGVLARREWLRTGGGSPGEQGGSVPRSRFLSVLGMATSTLFAILILAQWIPNVILHPCSVG